MKKIISRVKMFLASIKKFRILNNGVPSVYTPKEIRQHSSFIRNEVDLEPARPTGWQGVCLRRRFYVAWQVFTGR